ncbi:ANKK1, partial [Symbiodinium sp. KB8]
MIIIIIIIITIICCNCVVIIIIINNIICCNFVVFMIMPVNARMLMALFHYPNQLLESGEKGSWLMPLLELIVTTLQPSLFALGAVYWPFKASFLGNSTLGCYVIHFIFRDRMTEAIQMMMPMLSWDLTGLLLPSAIILLCLAFMSTVGPVGHYILIAPQFIASFVRNGTGSLREDAERMSSDTLRSLVKGLQGLPEEGLQAMLEEVPIDRRDVEVLAAHRAAIHNRAATLRFLHE